MRAQAPPATSLSRSRWQMTIGALVCVVVPLASWVVDERGRLAFTMYSSTVSYRLEIARWDDRGLRSTLDPTEVAEDVSSSAAPFLVGAEVYRTVAQIDALRAHLRDVALCVFRTAAAVLFMLGLWTRTAGTVAAVAAFVVASQDAFGFKFTLYTLFAGTWLLAISGGGRHFALRLSPPGIAGSSPWLVHAFVASVYAWSGIAKLRVAWLTGETLRALYEGHYLTGTLADVLFATLGRCRAAAWGVVVTELLLGPLLLVRRTRVAGLVLAVSMHAAYEWTAHPDVFGWVMIALLVSFVGRAPRDARSLRLGELHYRAARRTA
jgi:hypothetical protein